MPLTVFSDFHHNDLYHSLEILFEKRLEGKIYCPIGFDWAKQGIWKYAVVPETKEAVTRQYLEGHTEDIQVEKGSFLRYNTMHNKTNRMITLSKFFEMPIDIVIASVQNHEESFYNLAKSHWNKPKFIRQIGNWGELIDFKYSKNIMLSATPIIPMPTNINYVSYHQEFDLDIFNYEEPKDTRTITNLMNCLPASKYYPLYLQYEKMLPDFTWKMHGILGKDGIIGNIRDIAKTIKDSTFIWHTKYGGDGFGYCYSEDTEILTDEGWKYFKNLNGNEKVASLKNGKELIFEKPIKYIKKDYNGKMLHFKSREIDLLVDPEHRMYIERYDKNAKSKGWRIEKAKDLNFMKPYYPRRAIGFKKTPDEWKGEKINIWWARFLGWYLSEGCCGKQTHKKGYETGHRIIIYNNNKQYLSEIKNICENLGYKASIGKSKMSNGSFFSNRKYSYFVRVCSKELYNKLVKFGKCNEKYIPDEIKNADRESIKAFLECYIKGDGWKETKNFNRITTTSKRIIDDLQECAIKAGYKAIIQSIKKSPIGKLPVYRINFSNWRNYVKCYKKPEEVDYSGKIYCVSVPSGIILVRRNGKSVFCGNCLHYSFACGRPVITCGSDYKNKFGGQLLQDQKTCIDLEKHSLEETLELIRYWSKPENHKKMCENAYQRFKEVVDYDKEFEKIKEFLSKLK